MRIAAQISRTGPRRLLPLLALAVSAACNHQPLVRTAAPPTNFDRQIRNALDAGEGDYRLRALRERMAAEPENVAVRLELAKAYAERGYPEIALEISRLAASRFPQSGEAQLSLVRNLRAAGRLAEAIVGLEAFLTAHPQTGPDYWSWLGILRDESGLWSAGETAHRQAIQAAPAGDSLHNNLGYNLLMQKKYQDSAAEFREALRLNTANQTARNNLATALANSNATAQAVETWQSGADAASAHNNLAAVWMEKGNYAEAHKELELALGYNRAHPAALKNLELLARLDGQPAALHGDPAGAEPRSAWSRWRAGFKRLFIGPLDDSKEGAVTTASSH
jgi:Flp pilus assembly protein TadD